MSIRHYQPGDEAIQVAIFNTCAAGYPKFKPASFQEIQRRVNARDFDLTTRFFVEAAGQVVGYAGYHLNGRVSYPWCLPGHEAQAEPLFDAVLQAMKARGLTKAIAAYRGDWGTINQFFAANGFAKKRDMINSFINFFDMPTPSTVLTTAITPLEPTDVPAVFGLAPEVLNVATPTELEQHLFRNPYFTPESLFALRSKRDNRILAAAIVVLDMTYADPEIIDPFAPCFRLGAFGTEGMQTKRVNGLFSFLAKQDQSLPALALELIGQAAYRVRDSDTINGLAVQVPSDASTLAGFYDKFFRRQGSFPVYEKKL